MNSPFSAPQKSNIILGPEVKSTLEISLGLLLLYNNLPVQMPPDYSTKKDFPKLYSSPKSMAVTKKIQSGNGMISASSYSQLSQPQLVLNSQPLSLEDLTSALAYGPRSWSKGQNTDQMLEFDIGQGLIHVFVDVQAGSRVAKIKRSQNAATSRKLRQSKKQKMEKVL